MMRFAWTRLIAVLLVCPLVSVTVAAAQEPAEGPAAAQQSAPSPEPDPLKQPALPQETVPAPERAALSLRDVTDGGIPLADQALPPRPAPPAGPRRPGALVPLYVSFGTLQVLDAHSTARALKNGAVEANPALRGIAGNQAALLAVKAAGTTGLIFASEKIWKRNKAAAIALMVGSNAAMAWVVHRNYAAVR
jgi:hypothetical protein